MALESIQVQLRVIWDHVRFLSEAQMHPSIENRMLLDRAEKIFSKAERISKRKSRSGPRVGARLKNLSIHRVR